MLKLIDGLPPDVLGVQATGKVTHQDYTKVLIPAAEAKMAKGPTKMLYIAGPAFAGYDLEALWDDGAFGIKHWDRVKHIAIVTDSEGLRVAITMFYP